jgi:RNA polymerase sigma-70 factor (ECF subfamily)
MGLRPKRLGGKERPAEERERDPEERRDPEPFPRDEPVEAIGGEDLGPEDEREEAEERRSAGRDTPLPPLDEVSPRHVAYVRGLLSKFGVSPAYEYEDLVQEVLIQAHRSLDSHLEPRALLFGITRHLVFRWLAKRDNERAAIQMHVEDADLDRSPPDVEELWRGAERAHAVREAIQELPEIFREVFVRCEIDEVAMPDVARELGIPVNTGYTRLHLARARFQESMRRYLARRRIGKDDLGVPLALAGLFGASDETSVTKVARAAHASSATHRLGPFARWHILTTNALIVACAVGALWTSPIASSTSAPAEPTALPEPPRAFPEPPAAPVKSGAEKIPPVRASAASEDDIVSAPPGPEDGPNGAPTGSRSSAPGKARSEGTWARQIVGLARKGKVADATSQAAAFRRLYPRSTYFSQIELALEGAGR